MPREKYKIHELAKDFGMNSKAIIEILAKLDDEPRKHTTVLDDKQLDYIFETVTQNNQVDSFDAYFAATAVKAEAKKEEKAPEVKEEAKKEEAPAKKEAPKAQAPAKAEAKPQQKAPEKKPAIGPIDFDEDARKDEEAAKAEEEAESDPFDDIFKIFNKRD